MKRIAAVTAAAAAAIWIERRLFAAPHYRGPKSDHFDGERFHNHQSGWQTEASFLQWQMNRERGVWREWVDAPPGPPPPARAGDLRVTYINHATTLIQINGVNILTDPIWSERCSPLPFAGPKRHRPPGIRFEDLPEIDIVLVSHNHYDHLDVPTLRRLRRAHAPRIFTPLGNSAIIGRGSRDLDWWQTVEHSGLGITCVPSQHFCARGITDRNRTLWGGFVISGPAGNVYFSGDTGWGRHFAEIREKFGSIRLALLPIGAYLPRWFMKPAHISPVEAVDAHLALGASTSMAIHFGTFELADDGEMEPIENLQKAMVARGNPRFWVLGFGEGRDVP